MQEFRAQLPVEVSDRRHIAPIRPEQAQLALELKQISLYQNYRAWASEQEVQAELKAVASGEWIESILKDPEYLLLGQWQNRHLQAIGALQRKGSQMRAVSGFAWPSGFGLAAPLLNVAMQIARKAGQEELWAFTARDNLIGKKFLEAQRFMPAGSIWKQTRAPGWTMIDYVVKL